GCGYMGATPVRPPTAAAVMTPPHLHAGSPAQQDELDPPLEATGRTLYVLPLLFYVTTLILTLGIRAGTVALPFLPLHGACLIRTRLPWVIRVESHIRSP